MPEVNPEVVGAEPTRIAKTKEIVFNQPKVEATRLQQLVPNWARTITEGRIPLEVK